MSDELLKVLKKLHRVGDKGFPISMSVLREIPHLTDVFSGNEEVLKMLSRLSNKDNEPFIVYKAFNPGGVIIRPDDHEKVVYWLMKGEALIKSGKRILNHILPVTCFGELAVIGTHGRTAMVEACPEKSAETISVNWEITDLHPLLKDRFHELLLRTSADKLRRHFVSSTDFMVSVHELLLSSKKKIEELRAENASLKNEVKTLKSRLS